MFTNCMNSFLLNARRTNKTFTKNILNYNKSYFTEVSREPMLRINNQTYIKNRKIVEDLLKVNDITNFKWVAGMLQSDMFHEFLFQALSKI